MARSDLFSERNIPRATIPSVTLYLALVLAAAQQALAVNDWSIPCIQGQCSWDIPADSGASGTVKIVCCACARVIGRFSETLLIELRTRSGVRLTQFRTFPQLLAGRSRVATQLPRSKTSSSCAKVTTPTVAIYFKGRRRTPLFVCLTTYVCLCFAVHGSDPVL